MSETTTTATGNDGTSSGRRHLGVISTVQVLQLRSAFAGLLGRDDASIVVTANPVNYEVMPDTALLVAVADFGRDTDAAHGALLTLASAIGSKEAAQNALTGINPPLEVRSTPTIDVIESTDVLPELPFPLTVVVAAAGSGTFLLLLCCLFFARRRSKKVRWLPPSAGTSSSRHAGEIPSTEMVVSVTAAAARDAHAFASRATLHELVAALQQELSLSGNVTEVISQAAAQLGVDPTGKSLVDLARECMREVRGAAEAIRRLAMVADDAPMPPPIVHTHSGTPMGIPVVGVPVEAWAESKSAHSSEC